MRRSNKIFWVAWLLHIVLTVAAGAVVIWLNAASIKSGVPVNQGLYDVFQSSLSILLFPGKPILGEWLASTDVKWLFFPAVVTNSFVWAFVIAFVVRASSERKDKLRKS